jgi:polyisoprenyl-phosphate glycosyltransferase
MSDVDDATSAGEPELERRSAASKVSVVAPVYNEADGVAEFVRRARGAVDPLVGELEMVLVDDGSSDGSLAEMQRLATADPRIRVLSFSRNFGHQPAVTAGLDHASGDCAIVIDSDLQDPPEVIADLLAEWERGGDVVHAVRAERRGERRLRKAAIWLFYRLIRRLSDIDLAVDSGDFRLYDRRAIDAVVALPERRRFVRGLACWVGFRQRTVTYVRVGRYAGESKYPVTKLIRLALNGVTSFSYVPLQLASLFGFVLSVITSLLIPLVIVLRLSGVEGLGGQTTVLLAVMLLGGIQLMFLGVIGEYVGVIGDEVKRRPAYIVAYDSQGDASSRGEPGAADVPESTSRRQR